MKVLVVNPGNIFGGIESLILSTAEMRHARPELEPTFGVCFEARFSEHLVACGARVVCFGEARLSRPWTVWAARRRMSEELGRTHYDAAICHGAWSLAVFGPVLQSRGVPVVFWLHDPPPRKLPWLERLAAPIQPEYLICNSRYTAEGRRHNYPSVPRRTIYCLVHPPSDEYSEDDRKAMRRAFDTPDDATVIVQVGRLDPHKGIDAHLRALAKLRDLPDWRCWLTASPQRPVEVARLERLKGLANELGVAERVRFLDWQPDMRRVMAAADIYCQPNTGPEPFGITYVEALWAGLPVVASALGGALEIVTKDCGVLAEPGNSAEVADALRSLLVDAELRKRLSAAGPERAEELCSPEAQLTKIHALLETVLNGTGPAFGSLGRAAAEG